MSGAEAGAILGLISSIITIIDTAKDLFEAAHNAQTGLPEAVGNIASKLPLILIILKKTKSHAEQPDVDPQTSEAIKKTLQQSEKSANKLLSIFKRVLPKDGASTLNRYWAATKGLTKSGDIEKLTKAILEDMNVLTAYFSCPKETQTALEIAIEDIQRSLTQGPSANSPAKMKPLSGAQSRTHRQYPGLDSVQDLRTFLFHWLLPENPAVRSFESDHALLLDKRFQDPAIPYSTCDWIFNTKEYLDFENPSLASVFRIKGPPGCGKSVLAAAIIERLQIKQTPEDSSFVLYFYGSHGSNAVKSLNIVRVLLAQTSRWQNEKATVQLNAFYSSHETLDECDRDLETELWRLLRSVISSAVGNVYVVIDGLDTQALVLVQSLVKLIADDNTSILLSSRREDRDVFNHKTIQSRLRRRNVTLSLLEVSQKTTSSDIFQYVSHKVHSHSVLSTRSRKIRDKIITGVCERADGMFLYADLVLEDLKGDKISSVSAIDLALTDLPKDLFNTYRQNLTVPLHSRKGAETFCWIFAATSSLTWKQLRSTFAIGRVGFDEDEYIDDTCEEFIEHTCGQLIESAGDLELLRFIHPTIKDFLLDPTGPGVELRIPQAHSFIADKLLTFLEYPDLPYFSSAEMVDPGTTLKAYTSLPGRAIYSYATFNWYKHLRECDKSVDASLEAQVLSFLVSPAVIRWLKSALVLLQVTASRYQGVASLTADVMDSLRGWAFERQWANAGSASLAQAWIKDFVDLMLDWGGALEDQPDWIHYIHQQLLPEGSRFRQALQDDGDESIMQFRSSQILTKSSQSATWPQNCFAIDTRRDLAYVYNGKSISCYHTKTGLMTAEIPISAPSKVLGPLVLRRGILCPQGKYLAIILEAMGGGSSDMVGAEIRQGLQLTIKEDGFALRLENARQGAFISWLAHLAFGIEDVEFVVCLLELDHQAPARSQLFNIPRWATTPILVTGGQSIRWEIDDVDILIFSSDSSRLATPFGIYDLDSGEKSKPWSFALSTPCSGGKVTQDLGVFVYITQDGIDCQESDIESTVTLRELKSDVVRKEIKLSGRLHILAMSNRGRFLLLLRIQNVTKRRAGRSSAAFSQEGSIGIWDCSETAEGAWTPLLVLDSKSSGRKAPWNMSTYSFQPSFALEAEEPNELNRVLLYVPPKWKLTGNVRSNGSFDARQAQILLFEEKKTGNSTSGFGKNPTLRLQLPAATFNKNTISSLRFTHLSWSQQLDTAIVYADRDIISMSQDEFKRSVMNHAKAFSSNMTTEDSVKDGTFRGYSNLLAIFESSILFHVQVRVEYEGENNQALQQFNLPSRHAGKTDQSYEITVTRLRLGEVNAEISSTEHFVSSTEYYLAIESQYISAVDDDHLLIGCLEIKLSETDAGLMISAENSDESVFQKALQCFESQFNISVATSSAQTTASVSSGPSTAILKGLDAPLKTPTMPFTVRGATTAQEDLQMFEISRPVGDKGGQDPGNEATQFEVFLGIYDEPAGELRWVVQTTTAGEIYRSQAVSPEIEWVLHPELPLLVWLVPGQRLRISHVDSQHPPVTIAESSIIDSNLTHSISFSPSGRYVALRGQESIRFCFMPGMQQDIGTIALCDLLEGKTITATPSSPCNTSIDLEDNFLYTYHLNKDGGVESSTYQLPGLILVKRQYLTFIPSGTMCSTCGNSIDSSCRISVMEQDGVKTVILGHSAMKINISPVATQACEPLIIRITSPPVELSVENIHGTLLTISSVRTFRNILDENGKIIEEAFENARQACNKQSGDCSCPGCRASAMPNNEAYKPRRIAQLSSIMSNCVLPSSERIQVNQIASTLSDFVTNIKRQMCIGEDEDSAAMSIHGAKMLIGEEMFPWDTWAEFKEAMDELKDEVDFENKMSNLYDADDCGLGYMIPVIVNTFCFSQKYDEEADFGWSSAGGIGWIEEHVRVYHERFFSGQFVGARRLYPFPAAEAYDNRAEALANDAGVKGQRFRKYFGKPNSKKPAPKKLILDGDQKATHSLEKSKPQKLSLDPIEEVKPSRASPSFDSNETVRFGALLFKDGEITNPKDRLKDVAESLSDVMPGLGDIFSQRINKMMTCSLVMEVDE